MLWWNLIVPHVLESSLIVYPGSFGIGSYVLSCFAANICLKIMKTVKLNNRFVFIKFMLLKLMFYPLFKLIIKFFTSFFRFLRYLPLTIDTYDTIILTNSWRLLWLIFNNKLQSLFQFTYFVLVLRLKLLFHVSQVLLKMVDKILGVLIFNNIFSRLSFMPHLVHYESSCAA